MAPSYSAFALIGDRYHNADYIRTALGRTLGGDFARELGLRIEWTDDVERLSAETLADRRLLIVFRDGMVWPHGYGEVPEASEPPVPAAEVVSQPWMTAAQGAAVRACVEAGGAALLLHNVTYIAQFNDDFRHVLGAATEGHPPVRPYRVEVVRGEHPITSGASAFVVTDEQHYLTYDGDPDDVLLRSVNDEGLDFRGLGAECEAGWARRVGKGRVVYLSPGHTIPALWNPELVRLQRNAARWLLETG